MHKTLMMYGSLDDIHRVAGGLDCGRGEGRPHMSGLYQLNESKTSRNRALIVVFTYGFRLPLELKNFLVAEALLRVSISALRSLFGSYRSTWVIDRNLQDRIDLL
jgi:hypothetical protein